MNFNIKIFTEKVENGILNWAYRERRRIVLYFLLAGILFILSLLPYVNLYFSKNLLIFSLLFLFLIIFRVTVKTMTVISITILFFALPLVLVGEIPLAEKLAELVYGVFVLIVVKTIVQSANK